LVRASYYSEARELRGSDHSRVTETLEGLNRQFSPFGVHFDAAIITDVRFSNPQFGETLQRVSEFKAKVGEHAEAHNYRLGTIGHLLERELAALDAEQKRELQALLHERKILQAERKEIVTKLKDREKVLLTMAEQDREQSKILAQAQLDTATIGAQIKMQDELLKGEDPTSVIMAKQEAECNVLASEGELRNAQFAVEVAKIDAKAEGGAAENLRFQREHSLHLKKFDVLKRVAEKAPLVISGQRGDAMLENLFASPFLKTSGGKSSASSSSTTITVLGK